MIIDSHCHLNFLQDRGQDIDMILERAATEFQLSGCLNISVDMESVDEVIKVAQTHDNVWASVGVHPCHDEARQPTVAELVELAKQDKVIAIGETGLDFFRHKEAESSWQYERFLVQIEAAKQAQCPVIIHCRSAAEQVLATLENAHAHECGGVMHCFVESWDYAKRALDLGFYLSFSGILTFNNAQALQEVAKKAPEDRILVETDAPYLAPSPHRGKINHPGYVYYVVEQLALLRGLSLIQASDIISDNFFRCFPRALKGIK